MNQRKNILKSINIRSHKNKIERKYNLSERKRKEPKNRNLMTSGKMQVMQYDNNGPGHAGQMREAWGA